ncbi:MAG: DUF4457 domain-containing protein [Planctomycetes bacterium]|nr:DUF4457 domain-containing protein [Planctomycetota bacterium]
MATVEIGGPFKILARPYTIKAANRQPPAVGEMITVQAVQADSSDAQAEAVNLINGSGLRDFDFDDLVEHRTNPAHMWRSAKGNTKGSLEFDLGSPQKIGTISIWNYNDTSYTNRGVRTLDVSVWTQETGWRKIRENVPVDQAEGSDDYDEPTLIQLDPVVAQKVRFDALANLGDPDYIGLSEVRFFAPVGPAAARLYPPSGAQGIGTDEVELTWVAGPGAKTHNVYLGANPSDLKLLGKIEQAGLKLTQLKSDTKYYWRVDAIQADGSVVSGKVCDFTTGGLAGWWKLDESAGTKAADSLGGGHDGAIHGDPVWRPQGGKIGGALQFDGMDDYVDTGWTEDLVTWTVAAWVKSPSAPTSAPIASGPVHREGDFQINWNHHTAEFRGAAAFRNDDAWHAASFGSLSPNTWHHLTATFDGRSLKAYTDGVLVTENSRASGPPVHEPATLKIGRHAKEEGYFAGTVDDVCIFTYALSAAEVKDLHAGREPTALGAGSASTLPSLVSRR